jgi:hypothetical protein
VRQSCGVSNSTQLAHDPTKLNIHGNHRLITQDIKDLYVNIPIRETTDIAKNQLLKHDDKNTMKQICTLLEGILQLNYFTFNDQVYQPDQGIAMVSPISGITAEIFLQHSEQTHIKFLLETKHIPFYAQYVDDILII